MLESSKRDTSSLAKPIDKNPSAGYNAMDVCESVGMVDKHV